MLSSLSINEFAAKLAAADAPPGGGSTAAMVGLMGVSLLQMAADYSLKGEQPAHCQLLMAKQASLARLHAGLTALIDRDAIALESLLAAAGLPETAAANEARTQVLQQALQQAANVPLETARACLEAIEIGQAIVGLVDKLVVSDLMAGVAAAYAGVSGGLLSTAINLNEINDRQLVSALTEQVHACKAAADRLKSAIENDVYAGQPFHVLRG